MVVSGSFDAYVLGLFLLILGVLAQSQFFFSICFEFVHFCSEFRSSRSSNLFWHRYRRFAIYILVCPIARYFLDFHHLIFLTQR